jgi:hypothetical protein
MFSCPSMQQYGSWGQPVLMSTPNVWKASLQNAVKANIPDPIKFHSQKLFFTVFCTLLWNKSQPVLSNVIRDMELTNTQHIRSNDCQATSEAAIHIRHIRTRMWKLADSSILVQYLHAQGWSNHKQFPLPYDAPHHLNCGNITDITDHKRDIQ